jgi:hypothetical protein
MTQNKHSSGDTTGRWRKEEDSNLKWQIAQEVETADFEHITIEIVFGEGDCRLVTKSEVEPAIARQSPSLCSPDPV